MNGGGAMNGAGATGGGDDALFRGAVLCTVGVAPAGDFNGWVRLVSDAELEGGEVIESTDGAIEVAGGVACAARGRSVFALSYEAPIITRYDEVDGALVEHERVSFANFGLTSLASAPEQTVLISDTKAYFLDADQSQIIVWNPEQMVVIGAVPLTVAEPPEGITPFSFRSTFIDGLLVAYNSYLNDQGIRAARSDFWFVDPATDEVVATDFTEQCGDLAPMNVVTANNGDVYLGHGGWAAAEHALGLPGSFSPCLVRVRAGSREIDATYRPDLNALTGGLPTGGLIPIGDARAILYGYNTNDVPVDPTLTALELLQTPNWDFYEWEVGTDEPAARVESIPSGTGRVALEEFDGRTFLLIVAPDQASSELLDLTVRPVATSYTVRDVPVLLSRLGSEPQARMAQLLRTRVEGPPRQGAPR